VAYSQPPELLPHDDAMVPWSEDMAMMAVGDIHWAAKAMCYSVHYLRLLLTANRTSPTLTNMIVFRGCRVVATMRRVS
jgi:predicted transposase YdaD